MANETKITTVVDTTATGKEIDTLVTKMQLLITTYKEAATEIGKGLSFNPTNISELVKKTKEYESALSSMQKSAHEYNEAALKKAELEGILAKAARDNTEAELLRIKTEKEKLSLAKQTENETRKRKATEEELTQIMKAQAKSIAEAEDQNRKLRYAVKNVSDEEAGAAAIRAEYNKKIDENTRYIKQNTDAHSRQKMTIGDYKNQIIEAFRSQGTFNESLKASINIVKQQRGAITLAAGAFVAYQAAAFVIKQLGQFMSDTINTVREFEKANSVLASVLGVTSSEIRDLTDDAKRLGATTSATASQVTQLQTELAKLGFSKDEILASTEAVLNFALATGSTLPDAASLAGAALRIFNADAQDMDRYVSAMAVAANKSALSFSQLATAIPIVAPVANAFGFEIEDVLTLLAKLSDAGFDASMAATATRNIFLNLADSGGKLAKALGRPVKNLSELQEGLVALRDRGIDLNEMLDLTDKRSVAAFARFVQGASDLDKFKESITDVNDELKKSAEERVNNLDGSLTKLSSAWEGLMLTFSSSVGTLKSTVDWLTEMVGAVTDLNRASDEAVRLRLDQAKRSAVETAKLNKEEVIYYQDMTALKDGYIKQGLNEVEAGRKAASDVVSYVKDKYEKQLDLANEFKYKNKKLVEDQKETTLFSRIFGRDETTLQQGKKIEESFKFWETAVSEAEAYKYVLEKLNKYIESSEEPVTPKSAHKTDEQIREEEKAARERLKIQQEFQQSSISVMEEGYKKDRAQLIFNYQKKIDAIKGYSKEEIETRKNLSIEMSRALEKFDQEFQSKRESADITNKLSSIEKGSLEELNLRVRLLIIQRDAELKEIEKTGQDKALIEEKYNKLILDTSDNFYKDQFKKQQSQNEINLSEQQVSLNEELAALELSYTKGKIKKEAYEKEKSDIQFKYAKEALENELNVLEENLYLFSGDERLEMEKKIAQLRMNLSKLVSDKNIENSYEELEARKKVEELKVQLIQEAAQAIGDIGNSMFERQINNIDAEIEANQEKYDKEVSDIDSLAEKDVITKEEAEARKRAAEERSSARNAELEKKKAELQTRQAKFQKTVDISQAIANTAIAVMKAWSQGGIFAAPLAAMIAAIGAIQLATIIAQPIPKYAKGTDSHPGGLAVVGDGGKKEAVMYNGKAYITPSVPTLLSIPKGAAVLPDITSPDFYRQFADNSYFLTHNKHGEPVSIVNNFDAGGIIKANNEIKLEIGKLSKTISRNGRVFGFGSYKTIKL